MRRHGVFQRWGLKHSHGLSHHGHMRSSVVPGAARLAELDGLNVGRGRPGETLQ